MKITTKELIKEIINKELEKIKSELTPHFEDFKEFGELKIDNNYIIFSTDDNFYAIICMNVNGTIDNTYSCVYDVISVNRQDIFENIDTNLEEVKIKPIYPIKEFDINEWKQYFVNKYDELFFNELGNVTFSRNDFPVITSDNRVNFCLWHDYDLKHDKFKFNGVGNVCLKTQEECNEFEKVFEDYINSQKYKTVKELFPNLTVEEREQIGFKFANIARSLNIDVMYDKQEEYYKCNAYNITQDKANVILSLIKGEDYV